MLGVDYHADHGRSAVSGVLRPPVAVGPAEEEDCGSPVYGAGSGGCGGWGSGGGGFAPARSAGLGSSGGGWGAPSSPAPARAADWGDDPVVGGPGAFGGSGRAGGGGWAAAASGWQDDWPGDWQGDSEVCACGNVFMQDSKFCRRCGAARMQVCSCGNVLLEDSQFCRRCGVPRGAEAAGRAGGEGPGGSGGGWGGEGLGGAGGLGGCSGWSVRTDVGLGGAGGLGGCSSWSVREADRLEAESARLADEAFGGMAGSAAARGGGSFREREAQVIRVVPAANVQETPLVVPRTYSSSTGASTIAAPGQIPPPRARPVALAEQWASSYTPAPLQRTPIMSYPCGAQVNVQEFSLALAPVAAANYAHRNRIIPTIENGDLIRQTLQTYAACDKNLTGYLDWNNGEVRNFITAVFQQRGLTPPNEHQMYQLYMKFDVDRNAVLDSRECLCLVDALFRSIFYSEVGPPAAMCSPAMMPVAPMMPMAPMAPMAPTAPLAPVGPSVSVVQGQPLALSPPLGGGSFPPISPYPPIPASALPPLHGSSMSCATPGYPPGYASNVVHPVAPSWRDSWREPNDGQQLPPSSSFPPPSRPLPHPAASQGRTASGPAPKPPAWQEHEERPHLLEVELDELELRPEADYHHQVAWYESLKYYVSLHPRSEHHDNIPIPHDAPRATVDREYLVSQVQPPKHPQVQVGLASFLSSKAPESDEGKKPDHPIVTFKEQLALMLDKLDVHLVLYVWGRKSSMASEEVTLIGRALAPLHDYAFQRKTTTWGVFDVQEGHRVAEMRLRYHVATTPGPVQSPHLTDTKQSQVTINWEPPANDHGAPILGYKVSILLDAKMNEGPKWFELCECTKSKNPVYVVANLTGNTAYMVDVRAVNKVGAGDPCEFQITTAPVEPDPPSKPWIEEARDGCLNVAWEPPELNGGMPVTAYKIKMRKILGVSKWSVNPFGPSEKDAVWVDMGTVGAAMNEQAEPSMYNAWVGPLEAGACEYRFQVVAMNRMGESRGSELSDPQYT